MEGNRVRLSLGLEGKDEFLDELSRMHELLQVASVEAGNPDEDILTFAMRTSFLGVIEKKHRLRQPDIPTAETGKRGKEKGKKCAPEEMPVTREEFNDFVDANNTTNETGKGKKKGKRGKEKGKKCAPEEMPVTREEYNDFVPKKTTNLWASYNPKETRHSWSEIAQRNSWALNPDLDLELNSEALPALVPASSSSSIPSVDPVFEEFPPQYPLIGLVYLISTSNPALIPPNAVGEMSIGIVLKPEEHGYGYARETVQLVLAYAFETIQCHRVQALIMDSCHKNNVLKLFTQLGFGHEGTRRRSFYSSMENEWKDTTCLAILDTDWVMRDCIKPAPTSLWDELLERHERERQQLLKWDDQTVREQRRLLRSTSNETIRVQTDTEMSESEPDPVVDLPVRVSAQTPIQLKDMSELESDDEVGEVRGPRSYNFPGIPPPPRSPTLSEQSFASVPASSSSESGDSAMWEMLDSDSESRRSISSNDSFDRLSDIE